jgi:cell division protein FtsZ
VAAPQNYLAVIKVVGIGGGGVNAVNRMIEAGLKGVEFIAVNTDAQALLMSDADVKLDVGRELTRGLGGRQRPRCGPQGRRGAPRRDRGGAQGRRHGLRHRRRGRRHGHRRCAGHRGDREGPRRLTIGVCTRPFTFEGRRRGVQAEKGIEALRDAVDTLIVIPNDRLLEISDEETSVLQAFRLADDVLLQGVQGITDLITTPGLINTDFADVSTVMRDAGSALMGIGKARGEHRALEAARMAVSSPLLEASVDGARGVLLTISGGSDLGLFEVNEAAEVIADAADPDANIIFGAVIDDALGDEVKVTVIAAGFAELHGGAAAPAGLRPVERREAVQEPPAAEAPAPAAPAPAAAAAPSAPHRGR